jgi:hypothetical protein
MLARIRDALHCKGIHQISFSLVRIRLNVRWRRFEPGAAADGSEALVTLTTILSATIGDLEPVTLALGSSKGSRRSYRRIRGFTCKDHRCSAHHRPREVALKASKVKARPPTTIQMSAFLTCAPTAIGGASLPVRHAVAERCAQSRARGHVLRVCCKAGVVCAYMKDFSFDELRLADDMITIHIPRFRHFACIKCGSRKVTIRSNWPERKATGPFYNWQCQTIVARRFRAHVQHS